MLACTNYTISSLMGAVNTAGKAILVSVTFKVAGSYTEIAGLEVILFDLFDLFLYF